MTHLRLTTQAFVLCTVLATHSSLFAQDRYYTEVKLESAVREIESGRVSPQLNNNIVGAASALSYVYDCSVVSPGLLRDLDKVNIALVEYSKTDWAKLGQKYGNVTVAGALHSYVTDHLGCSLRK